MHGEIEATRTRARVVHRDSIAVRREGAAQVALVGPPNAGKSSLLQALSRIQIKTGDYAFTTMRPVPALTRIGGVLIQLIEIPGLIAGAGEGRGEGRALLGVLRSADAIVLCQAANAAPDELRTVRRELAVAGIELPSLLVVTKADDGDSRAAARAFPDLDAVPVSVLDDASLDRFRDAVFGLTGLIRVFLRHDGAIDGDPVALSPPATVLDVARTIHHDLERTCRGARLWGPSARFGGQRVGRDHPVADGDAVEIVS